MFLEIVGGSVEPFSVGRGSFDMLSAEQFVVEERCGTARWGLRSSFMLVRAGFFDPPPST
jgi:hypothetical protein